MPSEIRSPPKSVSKAEKGGAPEWHFADEGADGAGDSKRKGTLASLRENRFFVRAIVAIFFVICAVYAFNYKEATVLNKTYKHPTWFSAKPHWQTTEELRHRMQAHVGSGRPDRFPGESQEEYLDYTNNDAEDFLEKIDIAAETDLRDAGIGAIYDYDE